MPELPIGTVTFLFTDIEDSTQLLQQLGQSYADVLADHQQLLRAAFKGNDGHEVDTQGDSFFVAFSSARDATTAAVEAQTAITAHPWPKGAPLRVRMGLHTGEPQRTDTGYVGIDVHRSARICAAGHGGQILLSRPTSLLIENDLPQGVSLRNLGEHRLKDLQHPEQIFQLLPSGLPDDFPPLNSLNTLPNNLPIQLTSFVGREREIAEVKRLLTTTHLLTLTGSGGCGKTRLALQVGADLLEKFPDGVWIVELAFLSDPALVPQAVASALGVREESGPLPLESDDRRERLPGKSTDRSLLAKLVDYLESKGLLLIVDNCEHLIEECATLAYTLLRSCPNLRILATSREVLGIAGETAWRVPSLSLPDLKNLPPVEADASKGPAEVLLSALTQYEAINLFIDRAVAALPTFRMTSRNVSTVAQICHRLDGIPLAIELAAARVKSLSLKGIAKRLDDRFRLLTGGSRTALPRQQTLQALVDWSYDLLSEPEQVLLNRLSVFAGGWTLEAAESVCGNRDVGVGERRPSHGEAQTITTPMDVLENLTYLVNKSLVVVEEALALEEDPSSEGASSDEGVGEEGRYSLLETVRQYGRDKLLKSGEAADLRQAHLGWFLGLAERAEPELRGPDQVMWLDRMELEHDNLRSALEWSSGGGEEVGARHAVPLRLAAVLWRFWRARGYFSEGRQWLESALFVNGSPPTTTRVKALIGAGELARLLGDYTSAHSFLEESRVLSHELGDKEGMAYSLSILGLVVDSQSDYGRARELFEGSLTLFRNLGDKWGVGESLRRLAAVAQHQGDYERATQLCEESLALLREVGYKWGVAESLQRLGTVVHYQGDYERATQLCEESLALFRQIGDKWGVAESLRRLGIVAQHQDGYERAIGLFEESMSLCLELGNKRGIALVLPGMAQAALHRSEPRQAEALFEGSLALHRELGDKGHIASCLEGLGRAAEAQEGSQRAARLFGAAEVLRETINYPLPPSERPEYDRSVAGSVSRLGEEAFMVVWAEGREMSMEEAVEYALKGPTGDEVTVTGLIS